ncbi:MAG: DUF2309 domain-containing protein [bacterium]
MSHDLHAVVTHALEHIAHHVPGQAPLPLFVHHNTLHGFEHLGFEQAIDEASRRNGARGYPAPAWFRARVAEGRITADELDRALDERPALAPEAPIDGWPLTRRAVLRAALIIDLDPPEAPPPPPATPRDRWLRLTGEDSDAVVHPVIIRLAAAHTDEGIAEWRAETSCDLWPALRDDRGACRRLRARGARLDEWVGLPREPLDALVTLMRWHALADDEIEPFLEATAMRLPGWAGMAAWRSERPGYPAPAPFTLAGLLAARLAAEWAVLRGVADRTLRVGVTRTPAWCAAHPAAAAARAALFEGRLPDALAHRVRVLVERNADPDDPAWRLEIPPFTPRDDRLARLAAHLDLDPDRCATHGAALLAVLDGFDPTTRARVWLAAYEAHYRDRFLSGVEAAARRGPERPAERPQAQLVFCIDDREEGFRRHLEELAPTVETLGAAGFFGVAMRYRGLADREAVPLCPVVVDPAHLVVEEPRDGAAPAPGLADRLAARLGIRRPPRVPTRLRFQAPAEKPDRSPADPQHGFTDAEQTDRIAALLRTMGLTRGFARLVVIMAHGAWTRNNPHYAAYDCGACSGRHGGPNARLFAAIANRPIVRQGLAARGIHIPADTVFVGAEHDTCGEAIEWFDLEDLPASHRPDLAWLRAHLDDACARSAHERCRKFAHAASDLSPKAALRHVEARGRAFDQARPELGHATNAACIVGRRDLNRGLFLDRRAFLVSYDPSPDPDGALLEGLLAAVGPVGAGINLEYYFSAADPVRYGCDTKVAHNLCGLIGVMEGGESDLRTGLPAQMTEVHEPMRLLLIVEASRAVLGRIHGAQPGVRRLLDGAWLQLVALEADGSLHRFIPGHGFAPWDGPRHPIARRPASADWYRGTDAPLDPALIGEAPHA